VAVDLTSVLDADGKLFLEVNEDVTDILLWKGKLGLWTFTLTCHVQSESLLGAGGVAKGSARVVVWTLWLESHAAGDFGVWPNLSLKGLDGEDFVLEEHWIVFDGLRMP